MEEANNNNNSERSAISGRFVHFFQSFEKSWTSSERLDDSTEPSVRSLSTVTIVDGVQCVEWKDSESKRHMLPDFCGQANVI
mmetsp:Transcript_48359/g.72115  ORF Transcript_48359/g.72115 Transcript_48359/m.72115 type:complete len:82 (-) Transcript_48359:193-438(-)